ncbi:MAG: hypothetical protein ACJA0N_000126 [Pseudohongiellaceae bacterium]|jgi:hypothetical protein
MAQRLFLGLIILFFTGSSIAIDEPKYAVIEKFENFELRAYNSMIVAETKVSGSLDEASSAGFKVIADYIFGNNTLRTGDSEKVRMTTPVTIAPQSKKISMTAPVSIKQTEGQWLMHFVMPDEYTLDTLPTPNNPAVSLRKVPVRKYAVIRFSGFAGETKIAKKTTELMTWLKSKEITPIGEPEIARYNPPWTLPFFRRNEIMVAY